jgi:hypothetical protein
MSTSFNRLAAMSLVALVLVPMCDHTTEASPPSSGQPAGITFVGGTELQRARTMEAVERFEAAGLSLPPLTVEFGVDQQACSGHHGVFRASSMTISICSDVESVFEHELAHVWERSNVTAETRRSFMTARRYEVWSDPNVPWNERGVEGAAFVIQQGFATLPLPPVLGDEFTSRMRAFEMLAGVPAPRLAAWLASRSVPCDQRPTPLSRRLADSSGSVCE